MTVVPRNFDSAKLPVEQRQKAFAQFCDTNPNRRLADHVLAPVSDDNPERHKIERRFGEELCVATLSSTGYAATYERRDTSPRQKIPVSVGLVREGMLEIKDMRETYRLRPGDVYINMLKRNVATVGPSVVTRILFSQDALTYTADRPSTFLYFGGTTPMGQLLSVAMSGVEDTLTEAGQLQSRDPLNMIAKEMFLRALATDMSSSFDTKSVRLRERARGFVIEHMSDTSLSPEMIASYIGMSRAALFRLFAEDGGVMSFVTSVRLDVARSMLQSAESSRVGEIAYLCGFKSPSHFSASFRKSYGHAPSDLRVPQGN